MFGSVKLLVGVLQIGSYILVNRASPVTNFDRGDTFVFELPKPNSQDAQSLSTRISSLSASGRSYGEASTLNQPSSANGRILSQPITTDKDSITYPDDIVRDSYGNIVTPYTLLLDDVASVQTSTAKPLNLGHFTDVTRDNGQHLQFVIPSYSDGITEIQGTYKPALTLLPPLNTGNYNYPSTDIQKTSAPAADNSYQNEVAGSFSSAQSINPVPTGPTAITTNGHIGANNNSPSIPSLSLEAPSQFPSVISNQPSTSNAYETKTGTSTSSFSGFSNNASPNKAPQGSSDFSAIHVSSPDNGAPISSFSFANTKPLKDTQFVNQQPINIQADTGKYTGGFGGAPGILGEQKLPGYAVKPSVNKPASTVNTAQINNDHPAINSVHSSNGLPQSVQPNQNHFHKIRLLVRQQVITVSIQEDLVDHREYTRHLIMSKVAKVWPPTILQRRMQIRHGSSETH